MAVYLGDGCFCYVEFLLLLYDLYLYVYLCCFSIFWYFQQEKRERCPGVVGEVYWLLCGGVDDRSGYFSAGDYDTFWDGQISGRELGAAFV